MVLSYRDLVVWQKAMALVEWAYRLTATLPKSEEFGLKTQIRRAAISIPSNIAEGHSRGSPREFLHFLHIAMGSLSELETHIELAMRLSYLTGKETQAFNGACIDVCRLLHGLARSVHIR